MESVSPTDELFSRGLLKSRPTADPRMADENQKRPTRRPRHPAREAEPDELRDRGARDSLGQDRKRVHGKVSEEKPRGRGQRSASLK